LAVYTSVDATELSAWLGRYSVGALSSHTPIQSGIENTNYFVETDKGSFVLTLYERVPQEDLPFYLNLTAHLAKHQVRVAAPQADRSGALFSVLHGKPAALVMRLKGTARMNPTAQECAVVGAELARMHNASASYRPRLTNQRGPGWMLTTSRGVRPFLNDEQNALLANEIVFQRKAREARADKLPVGAIHADLFRDNVLFDGDALSGFIDFGFAATDSFVYDLAITVNDWCLAADECGFDDAKRDALVGAYAAVRALSDGERAAWATMLRLGALRFWLSRLHDLHLPRPSEFVQAKDPTHFERMLRARIDVQPELRA
jgi:homoserine kinase type II